MSFPNIEKFNPSTCISGKIKRINRITANIFRKYLRPFDITDSQLTLLFVLSKKDGMTQKQLSEFLMIEKSSLNRNLVRLFKKEFLTKLNFPIIRITLKGKTLVSEIIPEWEKAMLEIRELLEEEGEAALNTLTTKLLTKK